MWYRMANMRGIWNVWSFSRMPAKREPGNLPLGVSPATCLQGSQRFHELLQVDCHELLHEVGELHQVDSLDAVTVLRP